MNYQQNYYLINNFVITDEIAKNIIHRFNNIISRPNDMFKIDDKYISLMKDAMITRIKNSKDVSEEIKNSLS